jgi:hypothetical protein
MILFSEISGSYGDGSEDVCLPGCNTVWSEELTAFVVRVMIIRQPDDVSQQQAFF